MPWLSWTSPCGRAESPSCRRSSPPCAATAADCGGASDFPAKAAPSAPLSAGRCCSGWVCDGPPASPIRLENVTQIHYLALGMNHYARWALIFLTLVMPGPAEARDQAQARRFYDEAMTFYLRGDFRASLKAVNDAIDSDSRMGLAFGLRARIWHVLGDPLRLEKDCSNTLSMLKPLLGTLNAEELIAQGSAHLLLGDTKTAMSDFNTALRAWKQSSEGYAARARAWRAQGDHEREIADLNEAIKIESQALYYHNRGHANFYLNRLDKAVADLSIALKINRECYISWGLLGSVFARQGDLERALKAYNRAIALNPVYSYAYLGRAAIALAQGQDRQAFQDFAEAIRTNTRDFSSWFNRAEAYRLKGKKDDALADYRQALGAELRDPRYALLLGDRFGQYQLWIEAVAAYSRSYALAARSAPLLRRAQAWEALKKNDRAMADLSEAVKVDPASTAAWASRGNLAMNLGRYEMALSDFNEALRLSPDDPAILVDRGRLYTRTEKAALALKDFNTAIAADPASAEAYNNRGVLYANLIKNPDKALGDIVSAVVLDPQNAGYQFNLGMMRLKVHFFIKAIESFNTALQLKAPLAAVLPARAYAYAQLGDHGAALRDIQTALEKDSKNSSVFDAIGSIRMAEHDYEAAVGDLNEAVRLAPESVPALIHRGQAYGAMDSFENAIRDFRRAAEIDPRSREAWTGSCIARRLSRDYNGAVKDCSQAIEADPSHGPAYLHRGLTYLHLDEATRAISDINNAYQLGVRQAEGLLGQSYGHAMAKQYREAHKTYLAATALEPDTRTFQAGFEVPRGEAEDYFTAMTNLKTLMAPEVADPYVYLARADALHNSGNYDKAILEYTKALQIDASVSEAYVGRGNCLFAQESYDGAQRDFTRAIELDPEDTSSRLRLVTLLTARGHYKTAIAQVRAALKLDGRNSEAFLRAGNIYCLQKLYPRALDNYHLAAKFDPASAAAQNGLGLAYFGLRKYPDALERFSRAIALNPNSDRFYRNRGSVYMDLGQFANAAFEFKIAGRVNTDPSLVEEYQKLAKDAQARLSAGK
ncbi:MAG TPA: hypothetical protein DEB40_03755 [Elusimicrobia bacterium]|nr:hypothetical protein [Elusimicrobiota bacterium]HBT60842.1 hypothetical protein [Elusimicrobiota bacterium]